MTQRRLIAWSVIVAMAGGGLFGYLLTSVPPREPGGQLDAPVVFLFVGTLVMLMGGLATLVASMLHRRWPLLAGAVRPPTDPVVALRQGIIVAGAVATLLLLALVDMLDLAFVLVTVILAGLIEVFLQSRQ